MFGNTIATPADPILDLADLFRADGHPEKINLGVGAYKDETGKTPVLTSVRKTEQYLLENETTKNYLGIDGIPELGHCIQELLFGKGNAITADKYVRTAQTPGGTGALCVTTDFPTKNTDVKRVWTSNPGWPNHKSVLTSTGLGVHEYTYYNAADHALDFEGLLANLTEIQAGDVVLFHGCYHNPTGTSSTLDQQQQLAQLSVGKGWLPLSGFAYQGFTRDLEEDAGGLRTLAVLHKELLAASSHPKDFGLYNERVGACALVVADQEVVDRAFNQMKSMIHVNCFDPLTHGASVVTIILNNDTLRAIREQELIDMRQRIQRIRLPFVNTPQGKDASRDFSLVSQWNGIFSFSGLTKEQALRLREGFAIYAVASGCINVVGMTSDNIAPLCETIVVVL